MLNFILKKKKKNWRDTVAGQAIPGIYKTFGANILRTKV
jgi:hypothetical protein